MTNDKIAKEEAILAKRKEQAKKAKDAEKIVEQTVKGAVELLQATGAHPESKIDEVTTPGGVTIKGLNEMEHAGFTSAVIRGLKAGMGK